LPYQDSAGAHSLQQFGGLAASISKTPPPASHIAADVSAN